MSSNFLINFDNHFKAAYPLLWIETHEELRFCLELINFYKSKNINVFSWDVGDGFYQETGVSKKGQTVKFSEVIPYILSNSLCKNSIVILKDFHPYIEQPGIVRQVRNAIPILVSLGTTIVFISPVVKIPVELQKDIQFLEYNLPDEQALGNKLNYIITSFNKTTNKNIQLTEEIKQKTINAARGMTASEAENAFALALVENQDVNNIPITVFREKIEKLKKHSLLNYIEPDFGFEQVGGLLEIKNWIYTRSKAYLPEARKFMLPYPRGILLAGYPGTGKTLAAKAIAKELKIPLFQLDIGSLFGKYVGETEQNFRTVIKTVEAIGPHVLLIDEIEKSFNNDAVAGRSDGGTSSRAFATFLTWMSEKTCAVFIVATSNNFTILPPPLIRKGRFDELFWIPLPSDEELVEIFKVLLKKYGRNPEKFNIEKLVPLARGFTGAEIEMAIQSALFTCFAENGQDISTSGLSIELLKIIPQSKIHEKEFKEMEMQAKDKLRWASCTMQEAMIEQSFRKITI